MGPFQTFQDYLSAAIQLKSVIIKSKPERQEWEQAPPFFRCTAAANDTVLRARTGGFSIQYSTALQLKEQGNELINKDPSAALERYTAALSVFTWFDRGPDRASENIPLVCTAEHLPPSEQDQVRVQAGGTAAGLEAAVADLGAANQLEPANSQVRGALMAVQEELREYRRQERGMYGNMFQRGELYGDVTTTSASASTCPNVAVASRRGPGGGLAGSSAATAATAATIDSANRRDGRTSEDGDPELDPEDLLFLDPKMRKVWRIPFPSSTSTSSGLQPTQDPQAAAPAPAPAPAAAGAATRGFLEGHLEL
ncbi:hypothetical protein VOLCADRAFT_117708 [Volvox carteri f. nagariensis]|uniref:Uncharacterized protein n=1 Tax=Volvox carteri f. nagariensis TaxID=3068 RepID=D8TWX4_VOLCA|nr:uncharacterized protein VOLCADRAFT_117708 [Volvox carteri f. nagariensis]EFJ48229.1 hypothetical protein VOLCADRAFT_117708 [Volvox carteri f. nagariensis]|eukprot:XP_002950914.1 hypothetical protein VOLCADRAFT_117708 [Volvox carteri f. nagariensis]